jgi:putative endonuclease
MPFVYLVECADGTLYAGWTVDLQRRVKAHNRGKGARYTRSRRPVRLVYWEPCDSQGAALRREAALRRLNRSQKLALVEQHRAYPSEQYGV